MSERTAAHGRTTSAPRSVRSSTRHWDPDAVAARVARAARRRRMGVPDLAGRVARARAVGDRCVGRRAASWRPPVHPGTPAGAGIGLAAPTILEHGSDDLKRRFLRPIATGAHRWCQLFSEPGYGSDLAGLVTRADRDGDEWVVNGQKLWNTSAHHAEYGLLVARTDWDAPKHRGLTYFAIDMRQPGVEVRPVRQMNGHASFNEVFLTDARVPDDRHHRRSRRGLAGGADDAGPRTPARPPAGAVATRSRRRAGDDAKRRSETDELMAPYVWYPQRAGPGRARCRSRGDARPRPRSRRQAGARPPRIQSSALPSGRAGGRRRPGCSADHPAPRARSASCTGV